MVIPLRSVPFVLVTLGAAWWAAPQARASADLVAEAAAVAAAVQTFYDQTTDLSARFSQVYVHKLYKRTERSQGRMVCKKPGKMRFDYAAPNGKVIVANGQSLQVFEPGEEGEPDQLLVQDISRAQLPSAMAFLTGTGRLEDDFTFRLLDTEHKHYPGGTVLELHPRTPTPQYTRLVFYVANAQKTRGLVQRIVIIDEAGNRNRFDFSHVQFNRRVPDETFRFRAPEGTRRVEL